MWFTNKTKISAKPMKQKNKIEEKKVILVKCECSGQDYWDTLNSSWNIKIPTLTPRDINPVKMGFQTHNLTTLRQLCPASVILS